MNKAIKIGLASGAIAMAVQTAVYGGVFNADVYTTPSGTSQLFMDSAKTILAPVGTAIWFIADVTGNGIPSVLYNTDVTAMSNPANENYVIKKDIVDGGLLFAQPGKYGNTTITDIPDTYNNQTTHFGVMLWNDVNANGIIGDYGDSYGYLDLTAGGFVTLPSAGGSGNATFNIGAAISADSKFVAIPEPSTYAAAFGFLCLAGAAISRRFKKN